MLLLPNKHGNNTWYNDAGEDRRRRLVVEYYHRPIEGERDRFRCTLATPVGDGVGHLFKTAAALQSGILYIIVVGYTR